MSRSTLKYFATDHNSPKFTSANGAGAKVNVSDDNVNFLPLNLVRELKGAADDGNLQVRRLQYSYNPDASDSETVRLELARREVTSSKSDSETISRYYRQRHYDPNPAQFVSEDPLGFGGGDKNLYGYVGNSPVNYTDPTGLIAESFLDTLGNKIEGAAYEIAGFIVRNVHEPVGRSLADNYALESALRTGDSIAVGVAQTGNFVGFDIREFREDIYGDPVNDNLNETIVTISTTGTLVLGGFALSGLAAGSAAFNATATAAINVGLINAGIGLTTQLLFNGGDSSELDYGSLALDFGLGTLGSFVGAGVAAKTGGGLVSRIAASTAFEGAFAGGEQVVRNLANGDSWSLSVSSAIVQGALSQLGGEIIENAPVGKLLDKFNFVGGPKSARAVNKEIVGGEIVARSDSPSRFNRVTEDGTNLEVFTDANGNKVSRRVEECFVAGTLIATSEGLRNIEDIRVGDKVYSTDDKGIGGAFTVRTLFTRQVDCVYDIKVDGTTITSSEEHPFWVMGCGWKLARELEPGDFLLTRTGFNWPVDGVECREGDFKVYNFEISEYHTYYVSELEIFVHNMCGDSGKIVSDLSDGSNRGGNPAGSFFDTPRPLTDQEALSQALTVRNRSEVSGSDLRGAIPPPGGRPGHATKHQFPVNAQANIINNPERTFIGINDNGRQVSVFYKGGNVVITQNNDPTRVITAFGPQGVSRKRGGKVRPSQPVSVIKFEDNPNFVEIK